MGRGRSRDQDSGIRDQDLVAELLWRRDNFSRKPKAESRKPKADERSEDPAKEGECLVAGDVAHAGHPGPAISATWLRIVWYRPDTKRYIRHPGYQAFALFRLDGGAGAGNWDQGTGIGDQGSGKKQQRRFFDIAMASLRECQAVLRIEALDESEVGRTANVLGGSLYSLIRRMV